MVAKGPEAIKLGVTDPGAHTTPYLWKYTFLLLIPPLLYRLLITILLHQQDLRRVTVILFTD